MEGVTGMMARLGHVPASPQGGLYRPANSDFRFVAQLRLQRAASPRLSAFSQNVDSIRGRCAGLWVYQIYRKSSSNVQVATARHVSRIEDTRDAPSE